MKDYKFPYQFKKDRFVHKLPFKHAFIITRKSLSGKKISLRVDASINFKFSCDPEPSEEDEVELLDDIFDYLAQMDLNFYEFMSQNLNEFHLHVRYRDKIYEFIEKWYEKKAWKYYLPFELGQKGFYTPYEKNRHIVYTKFGYYLRSNEEEIFKLIKTTGPMIIRNFDIQKILLNWMASRKHSKINRFFKTIKDNISSEKAKPRKGASKKIWWSPEYVKDHYNYIRLWLKKAKQKRSIQKGTLKEWNTELEKIGAKYDFERAHREQQKFMFEKGYWILRIIEHDEELKENFYIYDWSPHDWAKRILAKFFDVEEETIRSILYR